MKQKHTGNKLLHRLWGKTVVPAAEVRQTLAELDDRLRRKPSMELEEARRTLLALPTVRLEVAQALTLAGEERVRTRLEEYLPEAAQLDVEVRPQLVAGAVIIWRGRRFNGAWAKKLENVKYEPV